VRGGRPWRLALFALLVAIGLTADLATKAWAFENYFDPNSHSGQPHWWIDGIFGIETSTNGGALFGMGQGYSVIFAAVSIGALIAIGIWLVSGAATRRLPLVVILAAITAGIMGNLYDRLGFGWQAGWPEEIRYHVRDWLHFRWQGVAWFDPWPNFNVADSLLVCGAAAMILMTLFGHSCCGAGRGDCK
jgi:signal peptidase II